MRSKIGNGSAFNPCVTIIVRPIFGIQMDMTVQLEFLGTGTSQGVPVIGCPCAVCASADERDSRLRSSVIVKVNQKRILIDTGPDFRYQMLRSGNVDVDAVLYTHEHMDHISGLDDIRAINFLQRKDMPLYGSKGVEEALHRIYHYAFSDNPYPGVPIVQFNLIDGDAFDLFGIPVVPIKVKHGSMPVLGFRFGDLTYITDAKSIDESELEKIRGSKVVVLNALRMKEHHSHLNLEQAIELMERIGPERGYFTHISHLLGLHSVVEKQLPKHLRLAYDGLVVSTD